MAYFPSQVSFAAGELAPSLYGREDLAKYAVGLRTLKNFTVHPHGGVSNRAGMRYVAEAKHAGKAVRLVPFEYSDTDAYLLEFGDEYVRFYKNGAQLAKDGSPYELETPYLEGELRALSFAQSADVLFIVHPNHPPMELARYADTNWTLEKCAFKGGPFRTMNSSDTTIALSSMSGDVTLTASAALFEAGHAGALFSVFHHVDEVTKKTSGDLSASWGVEVKAYDGWHVLSSGFWGGTVRLQRYDEDEARWTDIYTFTSGSTETSCKNYEESGTVEEPTRFRLTADSFTTFLPDGNTDADRGYFELTAEAADYECCIRVNSVTSSTAAQGTFEKDAASTRATRNWSEGAWSDYRGWPCAVGFNQDRLCFGGNASEPQNVWMSVTGDYYNFERHLVLQDDDAVTASLVSRKVSPVRAFVPLSSLVVLTAGAEWTISAGGTKSAITPSSLEANVQGYRGASMVTPVVIGNMVLFVQKQGKIIRDLGYAFESDSYSGNDLTVLATHLFKDRTVAAMDYQQDPDSIVWVALDDGSLLALTYLREQDVVAWSRIETDGEVESVCCLSSAERDEVWLAVKRRSGDGYKRFIEQMAARSAESPQECFFVDCGVTKRYETPQSEITGLSHLEGGDVAVLADGNVIKGLTVENGKITLKHPASVVHVGLPYRAELETLDLTLPRQDGTQQGRSARLISVSVRVEKSRGIKIGAAEGDPVPFEAMEFKERSTEPYGAPISLTTGIMTLGLNAGYSSGRVRVIADEPLPCTVISLLPKVAVASGR